MKISRGKRRGQLTYAEDDGEDEPMTLQSSLYHFVEDL